MFQCPVRLRSTHFTRSDEGDFGRQQFSNEAARSDGRCQTEGKHRVFAKRSKPGYTRGVKVLNAAIGRGDRRMI